MTRALVFDSGVGGLSVFDAIAAAGIAVSPLRTGRKPGTRIFTLREAAFGVPTAVIGA